LFFWDLLLLGPPYEGFNRYLSRNIFIHEIYLMTWNSKFSSDRQDSRSILGGNKEPSDLSKGESVPQLKGCRIARNGNKWNSNLEKSNNKNHVVLPSRQKVR